MVVLADSFSAVESLSRLHAGRQSLLDEVRALLRDETALLVGDEHVGRVRERVVCKHGRPPWL